MHNENATATGSDLLVENDVSGDLLAELDADATIMGEFDQYFCTKTSPNSLFVFFLHFDKRGRLTAKFFEDLLILHMNDWDCEN